MNVSEKIWKEYHAKLREFIRSKVSNDATADDILQIVFLKVHYGLGSLKDETKLKSWLYQITRNAIVDHFRSQKPTMDIPESLPQAEADSSENTTKELTKCLQPMIKQLPEIYQETIILTELKGLTQKEVAKLQGISISGVKSRVQRGRALLKDMMHECCQLEFDHGGRVCDFERNEDSIC